MIQAVFSASEKNPSFTIVPFTSCERDSDIIFLCKFAQLRGYTVERNRSFSVKFIDDFNAEMILETTDYLLDYFVSSYSISIIRSPSSACFF